MTLKLLGHSDPSHVALIDADGRVVRSGALEASVPALAAQLSERRLMFLVGQNDLPTMQCYVCALAGGAVPLLLSKRLGVEQLNALIRVYDPELVFVPDDTAWDARGSTVTWSDGGVSLHRRPAAAAHVLHEDLTLLMATSGSSGSPKLVRLSSANLRANAMSIIEYLGITPRERAITSLPFHYSYGLSVINSHLLAGASLVVSNASLIEPAFWRQLNEHEVTSFAGVPYSYEMLLKLRFARIEMPSVRTLTLAGGLLAAPKLKQVNDVCRAKNIQFFSMYGQTEATARIAFLSPDDIDRKLGSLGKAIPGGRLWLEAADRRVIAAPGEVGELVYEGPNVSMGYAERPEDLSRGDVNRGTLRTGDLARFDDEGYFFIEGRTHRFVKVFGTRIALDAVERAVEGRGLRCAVLGSDEQLVVFVTQPPESLQVELATSLGVHPSAVRVHALAEMPRLPTGKVDYQWLSRLI